MTKELTVREAGKLGGLAAAASMTPKKRKERAEGAAKARWKKHRDSLSTEEDLHNAKHNDSI